MYRKIVVLHDCTNKSHRVIGNFSSQYYAADFVEAYIHDYINQRQGAADVPHVVDGRPAGLKYGFYIKVYLDTTARWKVKEVVRSVGYLYNSYEVVNHFAITIADDTPITHHPADSGYDEFNCHSAKNAVMREICGPTELAE